MNKIIIVLLAFMMLVCVGGSAAYLRAESTVFSNDFTVGSLAVEITEDDFAALDREDKVLYFGHFIPKSPCVVNTGSVAAYVYLEIRNMNGLFLYDVSDSWSLISEECEGGTDVRVYAYCAGPVHAGGKTEPLFSSVSWPDITEGTYCMDAEVDLDIRAVGIQYDNMRISGETFADRAGAVYRLYGEGDA